MEEKSTITTKTYYVCGDCKKKMEVMNLGGGNDPFNFSIFSSSKTAMYCNNKECDSFGFLTIAAIKHEE